MGEPSGLDFLSKSDGKNDADEGEPEESDSGEEHNEDESSNNAETLADNYEEEEKLPDDIAAVVLNDEFAQPSEPNKEAEEKMKEGSWWLGGVFHKRDIFHSGKTAAG